MKRYFIEQNEILENKAVVFSEYNHIVRVMRQKPMDEVVLITGDGYNYNAVLKKINKDNVLFDITQKVKDKTEPKLNITAFLGLLKGDNMDFAVQKLSELSVKKAVPFVSLNSIVKKDTAKIERLRKIAKESAKQCKRSRVLEVLEVAEFKDFIQNLNEYDAVFFAYESEQKNTLKKELAKVKIENLKNIAFIIGSEGGFDETEYAKLKKLKNVKTVSLGKRILRAETAAINLAGILMYELEG